MRGYGLICLTEVPFQEASNHHPVAALVTSYIMITHTSLSSVAGSH